MDKNRAKQILNSTNTVEVQYENKPVWIEDVDGPSNVAKVRRLDNGMHLTVSVNDLHETGR
ncbi:Small, acid-soluble spore protein H [Caloramator mitchellensis]|uniref:Small, acid-soluble spore protein H n=1 Tax=Caloramator mitchellensis TaxID=908809 RepID=A0A0R3K271_CALMK|nr:H-type small acid-soluble spore protein [Caloramator mitchellensis]KRQ87630.1 Small, acid-soluble spore protein H [Caloramator mitchellensis]